MLVSWRHEPLSAPYREKGPAVADRERVEDSDRPSSVDQVLYEHGTDISSTTRHECASLRHAAETYLVVRP